MKTLSRIALLPLPLLLTGVARADFNPAYVSADAQWVVSVDINELRNSTIGKELIAFARTQATGKPGAEGQPAVIPIMGDLSLNFDKLTETINSATGYGVNFSKDPRQMDGALVLQGTPDLRKILEAVALQATLTAPDKVKEVTDLPFPAYSIGGDVFVAFPSEPVIIASKSKARLLKARDVVSGAAPSLAAASTSSSSLAALVANAGHAIFLAASMAPADGFFPANQPQTRMLQLVSSGMMSLSEEPPRTISHLHLVGSSDENADKLVKIVQGMVAMGSLAETNNTDLKAFLQSSNVEKNGRTVTMNLAYSSDRLVEMFQDTVKQGKAMVGAAQVPPPPPQTGQIVGEWTLDKAPAGSVAGADLLTEHTIENVSLAYGATITLSFRRDKTGLAAVDNVEIFPASGSGAPLRFEAENMRLRGYRVQNAGYASRGKMISAIGSTGTAQFEFPGEDGSYRMVVHYMEQPAGKTAITVSVKNPDAVPAGK